MVKYLEPPPGRFFFVYRRPAHGRLVSIAQYAGMAVQGKQELDWKCAIGFCGCLFYTLRCHFGTRYVDDDSFSIFSNISVILNLSC